VNRIKRCRCSVSEFGVVEPPSTRWLFGNIRRGRCSANGLSVCRALASHLTEEPVSGRPAVARFKRQNGIVSSARPCTAAAQAHDDNGPAQPVTDGGRPVSDHMLLVQRQLPPAAERGGRRWCTGTCSASFAEIAAPQPLAYRDERHCA